MVYASYARGYKGPGSNSLPSGPTSGTVFVDPEIPTSYEAGIKSQWLDNRLRLNGAVYYSTFKDFQASAQVPGAFPPIFYLTNAGELETQGVEIEMNANVLENFDVQASLAYTDAIFSDWNDAPCYARQTEAQGCVNERAGSLRRRHALLPGLGGIPRPAPTTSPCRRSRSTAS